MIFTKSTPEPRTMRERIIDKIAAQKGMNEAHRANLHRLVAKAQIIDIGALAELFGVTHMAHDNHKFCPECAECSTCNLRPCRDGLDHIIIG